jgi:hypothetical protein
VDIRPDKTKSSYCMSHCRLLTIHLGWFYGSLKILGNSVSQSE